MDPPQHALPYKLLPQNPTTPVVGVLIQSVLILKKSVLIQSVLIISTSAEAELADRVFFCFQTFASVRPSLFTTNPPNPNPNPDPDSDPN